LVFGWQRFLRKFRWVLRRMVKQKQVLFNHRHNGCPSFLVVPLFPSGAWPDRTSSGFLFQKVRKEESYCDLLGIVLGEFTALLGKSLEFLKMHTYLNYITIIFLLLFLVIWMWWVEDCYQCANFHVFDLIMSVWNHVILSSLFNDSLVNH
jgi:hypothetical protein